jgi:transcriptional regulator with XRE-family HTH domain
MKSAGSTRAKKRVSRKDVPVGKVRRAKPEKHGAKPAPATKAGRAASGKAPADATARVPSLGARLLHARLTREVRMKDVAALAGCSESLISKIENNKVVPSLNVLHRVCEALGVTIGELLSSSAEQRVVTPAGERRVVEIDSLRRGTGIRMERLVPYARGHLLQGNIHVIAPGGSTDGVISHDGEEVGYVISGRIVLRLGGESHPLSAGDSFCYRSEIPHGYSNDSDEEARVLFVNTPPTF